MVTGACYLKETVEVYLPHPARTRMPPLIVFNNQN